MRVFKFRAWDKFNAQYWYSEEHNNLGDFFKKIQHFIDGGNDLIIEQFTGLIDKNGKEVYEGDIIKWKETRFWNKEQEQKGVAMPRFFKSAVVYDDAEFLVSSTQEFDTPLCCFFRTEDVHNQFDYKAEVIGNIYKNPELLKQ